MVEHPEWGEVIQLQGDQRNVIKDFLMRMKLADENQLKVSDAMLSYMKISSRLVALQCQI